MRFKRSTIPAGCYSEGILYPFGHALGIGIKVSFQLLAKQADLPTLKTSPITLITIFQKTVRFSLNLKILVLIDGSDVYAQTLGNQVRAKVQGKHQYARNPSIVSKTDNVTLKFAQFLYFLFR